MKKLIIILFVVILILVLISAFIFLNSKPDKFTEKQRQDAINKIVGGKANLDPEIKTGNTTYKSKKVQFSYPAKAVIYDYESPSAKDDDPNSESFSFDIKNPRLILNYKALATKETNVEDDPAVKFRNDTTNGYTKSEEKINGVVGASYKKDRSGEYMAEMTTFVIKDGYLYTFSVTGSILDEVEKLNREIISSVIFLN